MSEKDTMDRWPGRIRVRDTRLHDEAGGGRIYTTAGSWYRKVSYVREDLVKDLVDAIEAATGEDILYARGVALRDRRVQRALKALEAGCEVVFCQIQGCEEKASHTRSGLPSCEEHRAVELDQTDVFAQAVARLVRARGLDASATMKAIEEELKR